MRKIEGTRPSMHRSVRLYVQQPQSYGPPRVRWPGQPTVKAIADWLQVDWTLAIAGLKASEFDVVAVGCEEGAMVVHFRGGRA